MTGITAGTGEQRSYVLGRLHERRKKQGERKDIVKEGTELKVKFTLSFVKKGTELVLNLSTSLGIHATAKEIAYSESSISPKKSRSHIVSFNIAVEGLTEWFFRVGFRASPFAVPSTFRRASAGLER